MLQGFKKIDLPLDSRHISDFASKFQSFSISKTRLEQELDSIDLLIETIRNLNLSSSNIIPPIDLFSINDYKNLSKQELKIDFSAVNDFDTRNKLEALESKFKETKDHRLLFEIKRILNTQKSLLNNKIKKIKKNISKLVLHLIEYTTSFHKSLLKKIIRTLIKSVNSDCEGETIITTNESRNYFVTYMQ